MKNLIIAFFLLINFAKAELITLDLVQFSNYVANENNVSILIDDSLKETSFSFNVNESESSLSAFRSALSTLDLHLEFLNNIYVVKKNILANEEELKYRSIKLNFVKFEDIANFLKVYEKDIRYEFVKTSKTLLIYSKLKEFDSINQLISTIDTIPKDFKLKISIIDTNLEKIKEIGSDSSSINLSGDTNFFLNLVSYPFMVNNSISSKQKSNFYTFLKYLNSSGASQFVSNPILTLFDEKESITQVVNNIPYKTGTTTINDSALTASNSYEFKDVGLIITVTPHIYSESNVYLDLELNVSSITSSTDNLPITSKKYLKQSFHLPVGQLLVLTGINKKETSTTHTEVPFLSSIPLLGWLFKYDTTNDLNSNLTIVFELITNEQYENNNINIIVPKNIN